MAANDKQVGGQHYKTEGMEHWDMVVHFKLDYFQGQITRYLFRWREKGGLEDLEKAKHFLEKYTEVATKEVVGKEVATAQQRMGPEWNVRHENGLIVASHAGKVGRSKEVAGKKVRAARRKG